MANIPFMPVQASYRTKFSDAAYDPFNGDYRSIMDTYHVPIQANNAPTPAELSAAASNARSSGTLIPTAFLLLQRDHKIHCYHSISKFTPRLGMPATPWDNFLFATKGDLYENVAQTTYWRSEYFHQVPGQFRVGTPATLDTALGGDPLLEQQVGPYNDQDAGTEIVRCRRCMYCPPKYVALMMDPVTPRVAWETLYGQIVTDGKVEECKALVQWLQLALVTTDANNPVSPLEANHPAAPIADHILLHHRRQILLQDFPLLDQEAAHRAAQQNQVAQEVGNLAGIIQHENVLAAQRRAQDKAKPVSSLVGEAGVNVLMRLCQVNAVEQLPPIWATLARTPKGQQIMALQFAVDALRQDRNLHHLVFIIVPALFAKVRGLGFLMSDLHALESGVQPFVTGEVAEGASSLSVEMWTALNADHASPSIPDLQKMLTSTLQIPKSLLYAREALRRLHLLLGVLFGDTHVVVVELDRFIENFIGKETMLARYVPKTPGIGPQLLPVLINKFVAIRLNKWYRDQTERPQEVASPNFSELFDKIEMDEQWEPSLGRALIQSLSPSANAPASQIRQQQPPRVADQPSNPPTEAPSGRPNAGGAGDGAAAGGGRTPRVNTAVMNPDFKAELFGRFATMANASARQIKLREKDTNPWPKSKVRPDQPMCLGYHVRKQCNEGCGSAFDHVCYTVEELNPLKEWCDLHWHP